MKSFAILIQILGFTCHRSGANKWLRVPSHRVGDADVKQRMRYVRVDSAPSPSTPGDGSWEEERKGEVMMRLDQIGNFEAFEDPDESIMDAFVIEQVDDYPTEAELLQE